MRERPRRLLGALADYGTRRGRGPIPGRKSEVIRILEEIDDGKGIERSPAQWRDRTHSMLRAAIDKGANEHEAREMCADFLAVLNRRFEAFKAALWRWAYDDSHNAPPLYLPPVVADDFTDLCVRLLAVAREGD